MSDRTWVEIVVLNETLDQAKSILPDDVEVTTGLSLTTFFFHEVNNAYLQEQEELSKHGIPYNYEWGIGGNYDAGSKYIRFTPEGQLVHIEYYESEINPPLEKLLELLDKPKEIVQYIQQYSDDKTPLPWDNQVEYGKRYRTLQLLNA